jgi:hypothetical protein
MLLAHLALIDGASIVTVLHWIANFVTNYREEIVAIGTVLVAIFTFGIISVSRRQIRLTKTLERAYLAIKPLGIRPMRSDVGQLVGYIAVVNVGRLPAKNVKWFIKIKVANGTREHDFSIGKHAGDNFLPPGPEMIEGSDPLNRDILRPLSKDDLYFYVWGEVRYHDGFDGGRWVKFCHRYSWHSFGDVGGKLNAPAEDARYHEFGNNAG